MFFYNGGMFKYFEFIYMMMIKNANKKIQITEL